MLEEIKTIIQDGKEVKIITQISGYTQAQKKACKKYYEANKEKILERLKQKYHEKKQNTI